MKKNEICNEGGAKPKSPSRAGHRVYLFYIVAFIILSAGVLIPVAKELYSQNEARAALVVYAMMFLGALPIIYYYVRYVRPQQIANNIGLIEILYPGGTLFGRSGGSKKK